MALPSWLRTQIHPLPPFKLSVTLHPPPSLTSQNPLGVLSTWQTGSGKDKLTSHRDVGRNKAGVKRRDKERANSTECWYIKAKFLVKIWVLLYFDAMRLLKMSAIMAHLGYCDQLVSLVSKIMRF